jgi:hypothetical protein
MVMTMTVGQRSAGPSASQTRRRRPADGNDFTERYTWIVETMSIRLRALTAPGRARAGQHGRSSWTPSWCWASVLRVGFGRVDPCSTVMEEAPMRSLVTRLFGRPPGKLVVIAALAIGSVSTVHAAPVVYSCLLSGAAESPPNASPGTGWGYVETDAVAHTMRVNIVFIGLTGNTTASHIHSPTAVPGTGTAGVATTTPTFAGFPLGVTSGNYDITLDMTQASSYNPSYVTAHGGNTTQAEADLFASIAAGTAYVNVHSNVFPGGEVRGFLAPGDVTPTQATTWGQIKQLYR